MENKGGSFYMKDHEIHVLEKVELKSPILIEGLPGLGWVGRIAAEYLIKKLKAKKIAELYSPDFPPQVIIQDNGTIRMMRNEFYACKSPNRKDLLILIGDHQGLGFHSYYEITGKILGFAEAYKTKTIYTLGGFGVGKVVTVPRVFGAATHKHLVDRFKKEGVIFEKKTGSIIGAAGLLLGLGQLHGMEGICLMGETHGNYIDARAAKNVLSILCKVLNLKINLDELEKKAKETEEMIKHFEELQKVTQEPPRPLKEEGITYIR
jgi:uncharacterized protein (TIGR00162 family)